jgi:hypothetical protein
MLFWLPEDQRQQMIAYAKELQLIIRIWYRIMAPIQI